MSSSVGATTAPAGGAAARSCQELPVTDRGSAEQVTSHQLALPQTPVLTTVVSVAHFDESLKAKTKVSEDITITEVASTRAFSCGLRMDLRFNIKL